MIIADFSCSDCGIVKEIFVRDDLPKLCPECKKPMDKVISAPGMVKTNCNDRPGFKTR